MFKKVVIADRLAVIVNKVYDAPDQFEGLPLIIATILFAFQIYCDFSGYSDIALGTAQTIGFRLMTNFNAPYLSTSVSEFWKRWHISLSTWFRDYLYIPLGGNRVTISHWYLNLFITFLISGFWHGANWTYVIWGGLNGVYLIVEAATGEVRKKLLSANSAMNHEKFFTLLSTLATFSLICFSWIFFRARNINDALYIVTHMFSNVATSFPLLKPGTLGSTAFDYLISVLSLFVLLGSEYLYRNPVNVKWLDVKSHRIQFAMYYTLVICIILFGMFDVQEQFIYFQF